MDRPGGVYIRLRDAASKRAHSNEGAGLMPHLREVSSSLIVQRGWLQTSYLVRWSGPRQVYSLRLDNLTRLLASNCAEEMARMLPFRLESPGSIATSQQQQNICGSLWAQYYGTVL